MYIRQQCLYSFEYALKMQAQTRLEQIFLTLDLTPFVAKLPVSDHGGPDGYSSQNKLRAVIAAKLEQIPTAAALVRRLKSDPVFRYNCGFEVMGSVPSEATISRFLKVLTETGILKELYCTLIRKAEELGALDTSTVSIVSS